jgi:hypothetical protein
VKLVAPFVLVVDATIFLLRQVPKSILWDRLPACLFNSGPFVLLVQTCLQSNLFKIYRCVQAVSCSPQILPRQQPFFLLQNAVKPTPKSMQTDSKNLLHGIDGPHSRIELMMLPFF